MLPGSGVFVYLSVGTSVSEYVQYHLVEHTLSRQRVELAQLRQQPIHTACGPMPVRGTSSRWCTRTVTLRLNK